MSIVGYWDVKSNTESKGRLNNTKVIRFVDFVFELMVERVSFYLQAIVHISESKKILDCFRPAFPKCNYTFASSEGTPLGLVEKQVNVVRDVNQVLNTGMVYLITIIARESS